MQAVAGIIFSAGATFLPHSPRWLKHVGREADAAATWIQLGFTATETEKEQEATQRIEERILNVENPWWDVVRQLMDKSVRKRTLLGCFLMGSQQVCSPLYKYSIQESNIDFVGLWNRWRSLCECFPAHIPREN